MKETRKDRVLPKTVAYVELGDRTSALPALLLEDFEDTLGAYARLGGVAAPSYALATRRADAIVFASHARDVCEAKFIAVAPGTLVYALIACDGWRTDEAAEAAGELAGQLERKGALLAGCALIPLAESLERHMSGPRMGHARRRASEATDELVLALRCAQKPGVIDVRPPWPRALYSLRGVLRDTRAFS